MAKKKSNPMAQLNSSVDNENAAKKAIKRLEQSSKVVNQHEKKSKPKTALIDNGLHKKLRVMAASNETTIVELLREAITDLINKYQD